MTEKDPQEEFHDPITALVCINAATARYTKACEAVDAARGERRAARLALNRLQQRFDLLTQTMKMTAPHGTVWQPNHPAQIHDPDDF